MNKSCIMLIRRTPRSTVYTELQMTGRRLLYDNFCSGTGPKKTRKRASDDVIKRQMVANLSNLQRHFIIKKNFFITAHDYGNQQPSGRMMHGNCAQVLDERFSQHKVPPVPKFPSSGYVEMLPGRDVVQPSTTGAFEPKPQWRMRVDSVPSYPAPPPPLPNLASSSSPRQQKQQQQQQQQQQPQQQKPKKQKKGENDRPKTHVDVNDDNGAVSQTDGAMVSRPWHNTRREHSAAVAPPCAESERGRERGRV
jgi:hypothetical protein